MPYKQLVGIPGAPGTMAIDDDDSGGIPAPHAPTHTNGTDQIANATPVAAGLMPSADKAKLDTYASAAAVVAGNILFSTGVGTSVWGPNALHIDNVLTVGTGVDADYHTIHEAVDAAVTAGADPTNWWLINVYPGTYSEAKTTIPRGIVVSALEPVRSSLCFVSAANPLDDLFIMEGGFLVNLQLSGVTDPLHACVRSSITGRTSRVEQCRFYNCSNGIWVENGSVMLLPTLNVTIEAAGQAVDRLLYLTDANTNVVASLIRVLVDASVLPLYPGVDPVRRAIHGENGAVFTGMSIELEIAHNTANQAAIEAGSAAHIDFVSLHVRNSHIGVLINAGVGATMVHINAGNFRFNDSNWTVQNAAAQFFYNGTIGDHSLRSVTAGATECSIAQQITSATTNIYGPLDLQYATDRTLELTKFVEQRHSSVVGLGGCTITDEGGLEVSVSAGKGWIHRPAAPYEDAEDVSWNHTHFAGLAPNTTTYIYIDPNTGLLTSNTVAPSANAVLLFQVLTGGASVRYMHAVWTDGLNRCKLLEDYLRSTRRVMLNTGLGATINADPHYWDLSGGSYYYGLLLETITGGAQYPFTYYYGPAAASSLTPAGGNHVDLLQYDPGGLGVLMPMGANEYRSDTLFITSDGKASVILGTTSNVLQATAVAEAPAGAPNFLYPTVFIVAKLIVQQSIGAGGGVVQVVDLRTVATTTTAPGAADHNLLANLTAPNDAHTQYLNLNGVRAMAANLDMGTNAIINVGNVDGVDVSAHEARHLPGGADAITNGLPTPIQAGDAQAMGGAASIANSAHVHAVATAAPVSVGTANAIGGASTLVHSDHVHSGLTRGANDFTVFPNKAVAVNADVLLIEDSAAAGAKKYTTIAGISTVPAAHAPSHTNGTDEIADATTIAAGFMSAADKAKVDSLGSAVAAGAGQVLTANGAGTSAFAANAALAHTITGGAPLTGGGALSTDPVITIPAAAGPATNGYMSGSDKAKVDTLGSAAAAGAGQVLTANGAGTSAFAANAALAHTITGGAPLTGGGALSTDPVITIPAAAGPATNGYMSGADKAKLDTLASAAAAPVNNILFSDGAGGSFFGPNALHIGNVVTVGTGADADYSNIHDAVAAAVAGGASATNGWLVQVYPSNYAEDKTTVPPGVTVSALSGLRSELVRVTPNNPLDDLFVMTGGCLTNLYLSGVTDSLHACVRAATAGTTSRVQQCRFGGPTSNGLWVEGGAIVVMPTMDAAVVAAGQAIDRVIYVEGAGSTLLSTTVAVQVPAAILGLYPGVDPIRRALHAENGAMVALDTSAFDIAHNTANQAAIEAGAGASVVLFSPTIRYCHTGILINAGAGGTRVTASGGFISNCDTYNWSILSATAELFFTGTLDDHAKRNVVANAIECSSFQESDTGISETFGPFEHEYSEGRSVEIGNFIAERHSSVVGEGGVTITDNGALNVTVSGGHGWVHRPGAPDDDACDVTWGPWTHDLTDDATNYIYVDPTTLTVTHGVAAPSSTALLLFQVLTASGDIRFMHSVWTDGLSRCKLIEDYLRATRTVMLNTGLAVTAGTTTHFMSRDAGSYYYGLLLESFPATATDFAFTYYYGAGGASSLTPVGGNHVDLLQYAPAGVLTPMTGGYFRSDTVFITSDGKMSVVMGAAEHLLQANAVAEAAAGAPTFLYPTVFILAKVIVQQSVGAGPGVVQVVDLRTVATTTVAPGAANHNLLANLGPPNDDHTQYLLVSGARAMGGDLAMGANSITGVNLVDGVDVSAHNARHQPGGADAISEGLPTPIQVGDAQAMGGATSFSNSGHVHACASATPVSVGTANAPGSAATFVHSDHVHSGLTRGANDFTVFANKATPIAADVALIEDSAAAGAKKYTTVGGIAAVANALTRAANDFTTFANKAAAAAADVLLIEDSAAAGAKKYVTVATTALTRLAADFASFANKATPTTSDVMLIEDAAAAGAKKYVTIAGIVANALTRLAGDFSTFANKASPTTSDVLLIEDAAAAGAKKYVTITGIVANALTRLAGDFSTFALKASPVAADVLLIEDSAAAGAKKYATVGSIASSGTIFGQNYQTAVALARTTTTNVAFQNKVTLTTPALTGTYRVGYTCLVDAAGTNHEVGVRLYNSTDAVVLGTARVIRNATATAFPSTGGFGEITFTGVAKTLILQWNSTDGATVVGCQDARVELWRVA